MLHKTKGIVLGHIKYKETSIIVKVFTRDFGVQSYIVNSVRTKSKSNKVVHYQALSLLDMVIYYNEKKDLHRISEASFHLKYHSIPFNVHKSTITLFLSECLSKMLIDQEENRGLFDFLEAALYEFDQLDSGFSEFHIYILLHMLHYLGHAIPFDDLDSIQADLHTIEQQKQLPSCNRSKRNQLLHYVIQFYRDHSQLGLSLKSLNVLESVFD